MRKKAFDLRMYGLGRRLRCQGTFAYEDLQTSGRAAEASDWIRAALGAADVDVPWKFLEDDREKEGFGDAGDVDDHSNNWME